MMIKKLVFSLVGSAAFAATAFAGTSTSGKADKNVLPQQVAPADEDLGLTLGVGYDSNYIFRGLELGDNWISTSLDWTLPLTKDLRLDSNASYGTTAGDTARIGQFVLNNVSFERLQLGTSLVANLGPVELGVGYEWYHNLGGLGNLLRDGNEVNVTAATKLGPVNFAIAANHDFSNDGWFFTAGVNTEIKLCDRVSLVPGASIGLADRYNYQFDFFGIKPTTDKFTNVDVSLTMPIKLTKTATLSPYVAGNLPLNDLKTIERNQLYGGVKLSVKF